MKTGLISLPTIIGEVLVILLVVMYVVILIYHGVVKLTGIPNHLHQQTQRLAQEAR